MKKLLLASVLLAVLYLGAPGSFIAMQSAAHELSSETSPSEALIEDSISSETSPSEALIDDAKAFAEQEGWTLDQVLSINEMSEKLDWIMQQVRLERPDQIIGGELPRVPNGVPKLYISGEADEFIRDIVAAAAMTITIVDEQPFSREELQERQNRVGASLASMGFKGWSTSFKFSGRGIIDAKVSTEKGPQMSEKEISDLVLADTGISVNVRVSNDVGGVIMSGRPDSRVKKSQEAPIDQSSSPRPTAWLIAPVIGLVVLLGIVILRSRRNSPGDS